MPRAVGEIKDSNSPCHNQTIKPITTLLAFIRRSSDNSNSTAPASLTRPLTCGRDAGSLTTRCSMKEPYAVQRQETGFRTKASQAELFFGLNPRNCVLWRIEISLSHMNNTRVTEDTNKRLYETHRARALLIILLLSVLIGSLICWLDHN